MSYEALRGAIEHISSLPDWDEWRTTKEAAHNALLVLDKLEAASVPAPKMIAEYDAIAFTWVSGDTKRYLLVEDGEISLSVRSMSALSERAEPPSEGVAIGSPEAAELIASLADKPKETPHG